MEKVITIAICSHNKNKLLLNTIKACQQFRSQNAILFVIHSGNKEVSLDNNLVDLYHFDGEMKGVSKKRNLAIDKCKTKYIFFTDDDCIPDKNWVENILKSFNLDDNIECVVGRIKEYVSNESIGLDRRLNYDKMGNKAKLIRFKPFKMGAWIRGMGTTNDEEQ